MYRATPGIREQVHELKQRLQHEHDGHKKPRLQMLYWLASGLASSRQDVAQLLGVHRHTIGRWLAIYAAGGLQALLDTYIPTGKPVSLAPAVLASPDVIHSGEPRRDGLNAGAQQIPESRLGA